MGRLERLKVRAVRALEKGNETKFNKIDKKRADMQLPGSTAALQSKAPYMMYDKKSGVMMNESPIIKKCGSKRYGKKK